MKGLIFVFLAFPVAALITVAISFIFSVLEDNGDFLCEKFFSRKKLKKSRNTKSDITQATAPADNLPPMREIQCAVCGYKFIPYNENRHIVRGMHDYGKSYVDGLHDAFDCPMCGCQIVVHPHLPTYTLPQEHAEAQERQADTDAPTSEI